MRSQGIHRGQERSQAFNSRRPALTWNAGALSFFTRSRRKAGSGVPMKGAACAGGGGSGEAGVNWWIERGGAGVSWGRK